MKAEHEVARLHRLKGNLLFEAACLRDEVRRLRADAENARRWNQPGYVADGVADRLWRAADRLERIAQGLEAP